MDIDLEQNIGSGVPSSKECCGFRTIRGGDKHGSIVWNFPCIGGRRTMLVGDGVIVVRTLVINSVSRFAIFVSVNSGSLLASSSSSICE